MIILDYHFNDLALSHWKPFVTFYTRH